MCILLKESRTHSPILLTECRTIGIRRTPRGTSSRPLPSAVSRRHLDGTLIVRVVLVLVLLDLGLDLGDRDLRRITLALLGTASVFCNQSLQKIDSALESASTKTHPFDVQLGQTKSSGQTCALHSDAQRLRLLDQPHFFRGGHLLNSRKIETRRLDSILNQLGGRPSNRQRTTNRQRRG